MIRSLTAGALLAAAVLLPSLPATAVPVDPATAATPLADTPVSLNGQLHVCGLKLCNQNNKPIQLRGMSTHGIQWYASCVKTASLDALANDWKADILRISMYVAARRAATRPTRASSPTWCTATSRKPPSAACTRWSTGTSSTPATRTSTPPRPRRSSPRSPSRHKDKNNIIYDIANEPNGVSWAGIKTYAEQVIPVIRAKDPDGVVFVGTHGWSSLGVSDGRDRGRHRQQPDQRDELHVHVPLLRRVAQARVLQRAVAGRRPRSRCSSPSSAPRTTRVRAPTTSPSRRSTWTSWPARRSAGPTGTSPTTTAPAPSSRTAPAPATTSPVPRC